MIAILLKRITKQIHTAFMLLLLLCLLFATEARAMALRVLSIDPSAKQVVLLNKDTGQEWTVFQGDYVEDWRISEVGQGYVIFTKLLVDRTLSGTKIPVPNNTSSRDFELQ